MIIDKIQNYSLYKNIGVRIFKALEYLTKTDFDKVENGRYEIDNDNIYYFVNDYQTKLIEECNLESHKKYIDVQYVAQGCELMGYALKTNHKMISEYNDEKDFTLFEGNKSFISISEGMFAILFPDDLHMPGVHIDSPTLVKKIVIKVKI